MSFDAKLIVESQALLAGRHVAPAEAEGRAKRLWTREEYVAALFVGGGLFPAGSPTAETLLKAATRHHVDPRTPRLASADLAGAITARRQAREAIAALITTDKANGDAANVVADSMRVLSKREPSGPGHPGFRWRIDR